MTDEEKKTTTQEGEAQINDEGTPQEEPQESAPADGGNEKVDTATPSKPTDTDTANDADESVEVPEKFKSIVEAIEQMPVLDLHELVKVFEKKFGVSAAAVAAAPAAGDGGGDDGGGLVTVTLEDAGANKIQTIKVVKEILGLGLKEAKDLVDAAPKPLKEGVTTDEADELKGKLEEVGAKVGVK